MHRRFAIQKNTAVAGLLGLAACCALLLSGAVPNGTASPATEPGALSGVWRIDFNATLAVNEDWKRAYDGYLTEARAAMRESLGARELTVDIENLTMKDRTGTGQERFYSVREIHRHSGGLRMTVTPENSAPYFVDAVLLAPDAMRLIIDEQEPIILNRVAGAAR